MRVHLRGTEELDVADEGTAYDLACQLGLLEKAMAVKVNGELRDLSTVLSNNDHVTLITASEPDGLAIMRHSTAHIMAKAILTIDPNAKLAIGPSIEAGFYYDFMSERTFSVDDFAEIERVMRDIMKQDLKFERTELHRNDAIRHFEQTDQPYKVELIRSIDSEVVSIYGLGDFKDLCRGPHIPSTAYIAHDAFRLTAVAGAYWRGDSKNDTLQRIYGTVFQSKDELMDYLTMVEEAKARDHRRLGQDLQIFHMDDFAIGGVYWLKNGTIIFNLIKEYVSSVIRRHGYYLVQTPQLMSRSLWEISGHWEKFRENMFVINQNDETPTAIKPMNCPGHIVCYKTGAVKGHKDLPVRIAEFGLCHRNESSGSMHGIMRLRAFVQDDGHIFCTSDQIVAETIDVCAMIKEIYGRFGFHEISVKFSNRPERRVGSDESWDIAEASLMKAADAASLRYTINKGEGAFYGPKLEFVLKDCLGREWQCGTLQVDFNLPERFAISYVDSDGNRKTPVMLHRALVGSIERFIGILIEHYAGKFPFWLAPVQIAVASITDESAPYAREVYEILSDFRTELDTENEKITYKIRKYFVQKVPAVVIVGKKEAEDRTIGVRLLGSKETHQIQLDRAVSYFAAIRAE
ncbi:MAG: threonine--tRNA ligase [Holosporales bacterium]|jgi:threonyl-tRNA synthetase|nr:threonine--tRNA ligase [Holosporales bacterium]